jgi:membrane protease YdiL (CAAX protease family)
MLAGMLVVGGLMQFLFGFAVNALVTEIGVILIPILVLLKWQAGLPKLKLNRIPGLPVFAVALSGVLALAVLLAQVSYWMELVWPMPELFKASYLAAVTARSPAELVLFVIAAGAVPGFCEEVAFRGFFQQIFAHRFGVHRGVWFAAGAFAVMHVDPWHLIALLLIGAYLGYLFVWTDSLWVPATAHFLNNAASVSVLYFMPDASISSIDEAPPVWALVLSLAVFAAAVVWLYRFRPTAIPADPAPELSR